MCWRRLSPTGSEAGQRALERSANLEAVAHLTTGLELLATLPDTPERAQQELDLQTTLGPALINTKGLAAPEVLHAYARARQLCQQVGETPQLFQVLRGLWYFYLHRLELQTARELGEQLLTLAQQVGDPVLLLEAHYALGNTLNYLGEFARCPDPFRAGYHPLRPPAAPCPCLSLRAGSWGGVPRLCRCDLVVSRLSRPGSAAEP